MAIRFACPGCGKAFNADEKFAGRSTTCPACSESITVPSVASITTGTSPSGAPRPSLTPPTAPPYAPIPREAAFNPYASPQSDLAGSQDGAAGDDRPVVYAGFFRRFAAAFLDGIVTGIAGGVVGAVFGAFVGAIVGIEGLEPGKPGYWIITLGSNALGTVIAWLYGALMESSESQATLGEMALGMRVTDLNGRRIGFGRATGRHFGKLLSGILLGIGYLMQPFTERKQALHDKMAGCVVVMK